MATWLAALIGSILVSASVLVLAVVIGAVGRHFDGVANMFFAVMTMQLRLIAEQYEYEGPNWLKMDDDEDQLLDMPPPTELRLVKITKDKKEE